MAAEVELVEVLRQAVKAATQAARRERASRERRRDNRDCCLTADAANGHRAGCFLKRMQIRSAVVGIGSYRFPTL